jgi:hypothetical protein
MLGFFSVAPFLDLKGREVEERKGRECKLNLV